MFGIGFTELVIIVLAVIVFVRPEDFPEFFRKAGKIFAEIKKAYNEVVEVKDDFLREIDISAAEEAAGIVHEEAPAGKDEGKTSPEEPAPEGGGEKTETPETSEKTGEDA